MYEDVYYFSVYVSVLSKYTNIFYMFLYFHLILSMAFKKYLKYVFLKKINIFVSDFSVIQEFFFLTFKIGLIIIYVKNR